jgi:hypothetical protein
MMKSKKIKISLIVISGLSLIAYIFSFFSSSMTELSENPIKLERNIPVDYLSLFNPQVQKDIILQSAAPFKLRNTIVDIVYDNKYDLMITKTPLKSEFQLKDGVTEVNEKSKSVPPRTNSSYNQGNFRIIYNGNSKHPVSKIYLTVEGDSTTTYHKNDSITYYYSYLKHIYLKYEHEGVDEITIEAKKRLYFLDQKKPIIIMFIKKNISYTLLL